MLDGQTVASGEEEGAETRLVIIAGGVADYCGDWGGRWVTTTLSDRRACRNEHENAVHEAATTTHKSHNESSVREQKRKRKRERDR